MQLRSDMVRLEALLCFCDVHVYLCTVRREKWSQQQLLRGGILQREAALQPLGLSSSTSFFLVEVLEVLHDLQQGIAKGRGVGGRARAFAVDAEVDCGKERAKRRPERERECVCEMEEFG